MLVATLGGGTRMRQMRKVRLIKTALLEVTQLALMLTHQGWAWGQLGKSRGSRGGSRGKDRGPLGGGGAGQGSLGWHAHQGMSLKSPGPKVRVQIVAHQLPGCVALCQQAAL